MVSSQLLKDYLNKWEAIGKKVEEEIDNDLIWKSFNHRTSEITILSIIPIGFRSPGSPTDLK